MQTRTTIRIAVALAVSFSPCAAPAARAEDESPADAKPAAEGKWIQLFNGKNLDGWTPKIRHAKPGENPGNTFRVEDGLLKVGYDQYEKFDEKFGHLFYNEPFSHYRLRVEYRFVGEQCPGGPGWAIRNSGIMIHGETADEMTVDQDFPASIEVQLLGGANTGERPTANLCTPGTNVVMDGQLITRHCTNSKAKTYRGDEWVTVEVEVHGSKVIRHIVEGKTVLEYHEPQLDERDAHAKALAAKKGGKMLEGGTISLQSESHPVEFRKVELMKLEE
ncbi:MAG: family 16 glycoside hydrolase [Pirellulales bacterium]